MPVYTWYIPKTGPWTSGWIQPQPWPTCILQCPGLMSGDIPYIYLYPRHLLQRGTYYKIFNPLDLFHKTLSTIFLFQHNYLRKLLPIISLRLLILNIKDDLTNYLIISTSPFKVVFNDYKTYKKYKQQVFELDDPYLKMVDHYLLIYVYVIDILHHQI